MISLENKAVFPCSRPVSTEEPVANLDLQIKGGGGGHPDPEIRGGGWSEN